ncbi:MAG: hypothetical protein WCD12_20875, partial [Candidatus Binatus sp.]
MASSSTSKRPPTTAGSESADAMSAANVAGTIVSACTNTRASPCDARAPAFIWRARPRDALIT